MTTASCQEAEKAFRFGESFFLLSHHPPQCYVKRFSLEICLLLASYPPLLHCCVVWSCPLQHPAAYLRTLKPSAALHAAARAPLSHQSVRPLCVPALSSGPQVAGRGSTVQVSLLFSGCSHCSNAAIQSVLPELWDVPCCGKAFLRSFAHPPPLCL